MITARDNGSTFRGQSNVCLANVQFLVPKFIAEPDTNGAGGNAHAHDLSHRGPCLVGRQWSITRRNGTSIAVTPDCHDRRRVVVRCGDMSKGAQPYQLRRKGSPWHRHQTQQAHCNTEKTSRADHKEFLSNRRNAVRNCCVPPDGHSSQTCGMEISDWCLSVCDGSNEALRSKCSHDVRDVSCDDILRAAGSSRIKWNRTEMRLRGPKTRFDEISYIEILSRSAKYGGLDTDLIQRTSNFSISHPGVKHAARDQYKSKSLHTPASHKSEIRSAQEAVGQPDAFTRP